MSATPNYGLPYPGQDDPPNGPAQLQALADAVDVALHNVKLASDQADTAQGGSTATLSARVDQLAAALAAVQTAAAAELLVDRGFLTGNGASLAPGAGRKLGTVTFGRAYSSPPVVVASLGNAPGNSGVLTVRAINATASTFDLYVYNVGSTTTDSSLSVRCNWIAAGNR